MKLEFKLLKINKGNILFNQVRRFNSNNEFVAVGQTKIQGKEYLKVLQLLDCEDGSKGLKLIGGSKLDLLSYSIIKSELKPKDYGTGIDSLKIEVPGEYLTIELIKTIQRLNDI